jgi:ABC-type transport system substrate-binding protein
MGTWRSKNFFLLMSSGYPNIIGDLARSWMVSDDKTTWTFTLHQGVTFHDDSPLTSADAKASWDKIISPPEGVVSPRKSYYLAKEMQQEIMQKAWWLPALWWRHAEVRPSRIRNYEPHPNHWMNRRLEDVWLAKK